MKRYPDPINPNKIKYPGPVIGFCLLLLISCSKGGDKRTVLTIPVERRDYIDKITLTGILESTKTAAIQAPRIWYDLTILWMIEEGTFVSAGDTVCILESNELEEDYSRAVDRYNIAVAEFNKSKADLDLQYAMLQSQVNSIDLTTAIKRLDSLQLEFTSPLDRKIIELELEKAETERQKLTGKLEFLKSINDSQMKKMELKITQEKNKIEQAIDQMNKLVLTSMVDGLVIYQENRSTGLKFKEGDEVWGGRSIIEIPRMDELQTRLFANETQFKQIQEGQEVEVRVDARRELKLPGLIKRKSPVGKPVKRRSKVKVFEITAALDSSNLSVQPGLTVTCDVFINRLQDTLIIPMVSVFEDDSLKVVYVEKGKLFGRQEIEIALANTRFAVVKAGLSGTESIAITKPRNSQILN